MKSSNPMLEKKRKLPSRTPSRKQIRKDAGTRDRDIAINLQRTKPNQSCRAKSQLQRERALTKRLDRSGETQDIADTTSKNERLPTTFPPWEQGSEVLCEDDGFQRITVSPQSMNCIDPRSVMLVGDNLNLLESAQRATSPESKGIIEVVETSSAPDSLIFDATIFDQDAMAHTLNLKNDVEGLDSALMTLSEHDTLDVDDGWPVQDPIDDALFADIDLMDALPEWLEEASPPTVKINSTRSKHLDLPAKCKSFPLHASQDSCALTLISGNARRDVPAKSIQSDGSENEYPDSELDASLVDLTTSEPIQPPTPQTSPQRSTTPKLQWLPPKEYISVKKSPRPASPETPYTVLFNAKGDPISFMRPSFPKPVLDRSPILGLTNRTGLRVCFRIGEALNAASVASRTNTDAIIELYARVIFSKREGFKQYFQFADLFTDKPPYLHGIYGMWKGVGLWEQDSGAFLGEEGRGKMCRVLGRIKRTTGAEMSILSVWECAWEDVGVAKGIVCS